MPTLAAVRTLLGPWPEYSAQGGDRRLFAGQLQLFLWLSAACLATGSILLPGFPFSHEQLSGSLPGGAGRPPACFQCVVL